MRLYIYNIANSNISLLFILWNSHVDTYHSRGTIRSFLRHAEDNQKRQNRVEYSFFSRLDTFSGLVWLELSDDDKKRRFTITTIKSMSRVRESSACEDNEDPRGQACEKVGQTRNVDLYVRWIYAFEEHNRIARRGPAVPLSRCTAEQDKQTHL